MTAGGTASAFQALQPASRRARSVGRLEVGRPVGESDHACLAYSSGAERDAAAIAWLADGLQLGQRACYIAQGPTTELVAELAELPAALTALENGALTVHSIEQWYDLGGPIDAAAQLASYDEALRRAVVDGYRGIRVAVDITPLVADPARREAHVRWEQVAERYLTNHPLAPLCMYDAREVHGLDAIACVHPLRGPDNQSFALYGGGPTRAVLRGELDACSAELFTTVLHGLPSSDTVIDVTNLSFIDARSAWILQDELLRRGRHGQQLRLAEPSRQVQQIWRICDFDRTLLAVA